MQDAPSSATTVAVVPEGDMYITDKSGRLPDSVLGASLAQTTFTNDPEAESLAAEAPPGQSASVTAVLPTLYDIAPLNLVLRMADEKRVST